MQTPSSADLFDRQMAGRVLVTNSNNFVERPWGGTSLREFKALCPLPDQVELTGAGLGESFELAAFDDDAEAARYPSKVRDASGAQINLSELLRTHADSLLSAEWTQKYGRCIPLLPKFLNVRELLSVQGHPGGHTEAYVVVAAEPGATIRLGFRRDIDSGDFAHQLNAGRMQQRELADLLGQDVDWFAAQRLLAVWFAERESDPSAVLPQLFECCNVYGSAIATQAARLLNVLKQQYWLVLDAMNEIELSPGQVIHNSNPQRIVDARGCSPAAEVHALGNPQRREFIMLEVRRPGPTLRAWDNVRFPMRDIDIDGAIKVFNLEATKPEEFLCTRSPLATKGHTLSVDSPYFRIEHIEAAEGESLESASADAHCLHVLAGTAEITTKRSAEPTLMKPGDSAFVPVGVEGWHVCARNGDLHLVKVHLP